MHKASFLLNAERALLDLQSPHNVFLGHPVDSHCFHPRSISRRDFNVPFWDAQFFGKQHDEGFVRHAFHRGRSNLYLVAVSFTAEDLVS
jgi:hypothetical protein